LLRLLLRRTETTTRGGRTAIRGRRTIRGRRRSAEAALLRAERARVCDGAAHRVDGRRAERLLRGRTGRRTVRGRRRTVRGRIRRPARLPERGRRAGGRDADHRSLQLARRLACRRRPAGCAERRRRRGGRLGRPSRRRRDGRRRLRGLRLIHQHRALELRGRSALQVEAALAAGLRAIRVLGPTIRAEHSSTSNGPNVRSERAGAGHGSPHQLSKKGASRRG
jgi:hypothetical protein